ncbi:hypothetical protein RHSIM_Rhsim03G0067100 [Rhododendron simsii]|uniref:Lipid droplet-associated hydrolase n=1 Tax=Rhododendron simsii TaxID=118357 RepID=A0A834LSK5_RHOSS|nr:hypothetical protein RHSIM_Rhsim03G0067100 [Rhododendron simsii]
MCICFRTRHLTNCARRAMGLETMDKTHLIGEKRSVNFRLHNVSGYKTELLEIQAADPKLHVLFIPGNPGVVSFYADFLENLYELLDGTASITGKTCLLLSSSVGYISHTKKNWEHRRLFSLEEQINHKMDFIKLELQNIEVPLILVGHSIGSYMSIEVLRRLPEKVIYCIGLYPFLAVNTQSSEQSSIGRLANLVWDLIVFELGASKVFGWRNKIINNILGLTMEEQVATKPSSTITLASKELTEDCHEVDHALATTGAKYSTLCALVPKPAPLSNPVQRISPKEGKDLTGQLDVALGNINSQESLEHHVAWIFYIRLRDSRGSPILSVAVSSAVGLLGLLPTKASRFLVRHSVGKSWCTSAVEALCTHVLQYHVMRNVLFLAMTEFKTLSETPDWSFMREKQSQIAFLFGAEDHWGPLQMFDEISSNVPGAALAVEREGHSHAFSCTTAGSLWVAQHVANLIKSRHTSSSQ